MYSIFLDRSYSRYTYNIVNIVPKTKLSLKTSEKKINFTACEQIEN